MTTIRALLATTVLALAAFVPPAHAEVSETGAGSFAIDNAITVAAPPRTVWLALTRPAEWWSDDHTWSGDAANLTLTPQAGGCFCERIPGEGDIPLDGSAMHGTVIQAVPERALRLSAALGPLQAVPATGILTFTLAAEGPGTVVTLRYAVNGATGFDTAQVAKSVDAVLAAQLEGLRAHLAGGAE